MLEKAHDSGEYKNSVIPFRTTVTIELACDRYTQVPWCAFSLVKTTDIIDALFVSVMIAVSIVKQHVVRVYNS